MRDCDATGWLGGWYLARCDGDWEHDFGVRIETLDNPGWKISIDLAGSALAARAFASVRHGQPSENLEDWRSLGSWWICEVKEDRFEAYCGPLDLAAAIGVFRQWAENA